MGLKARRLLGGSCLVSQKTSTKLILRDCYGVSYRIVALSFPSDQIRATYQVMGDCGHHKVYNLCSDQVHDIDLSEFKVVVERFPFDDIHVPSLSMIKEFCESVESWLSNDPKNIAIINTMAGTYQASLMLSSYLVYKGMLGDEALQIYLGGTMPRQRRYVNYWQQSLSCPLGFPPKIDLPKQCSREIKRIRLHDTKNIETVFFVLSEMQEVPGQRYRQSSDTCQDFCKNINSGIIYNSHQHSYPFIEKEEDTIDLLDYYFTKTLQATGDVCVMFYEKDTRGHLFSAYFNTAFIENSSIQFLISELDEVGNRGKSVEGPKFYVEFLFGPANPNEDVISNFENVFDDVF